MDLLWNMSLQVALILTFIFGMVGMVFSSLLLIFPKQAESLSGVCNRYVDIDDKIKSVDRRVQLDTYFYAHNIGFGVCLFFGSVVSLIFFILNLDQFGAGVHGLNNGLFFSSISVIWKIASLIGVVLGIILIFAPDKIRGIGNSVNSWFDTESMIKRLDRSIYELDVFIFRKPVFLGLTGVLISLIVLISSIIMLSK